MAKSRWSGNYVPSEKGEKNSGELITAPDQSFTIRELFEKFRSGLLKPEQIQLQTQFGETEDFDAPDVEAITKSDLLDRQEYADILRYENDVAKAKVSAAAEAAAAKKAKAKKEERSDDKGAEPKAPAAADAAAAPPA